MWKKQDFSVGKTGFFYEGKVFLKYEKEGFFIFMLQDILCMPEIRSRPDLQKRKKMFLIISKVFIHIPLHLIKTRNPSYKVYFLGAERFVSALQSSCPDC